MYVIAAVSPRGEWAESVKIKNDLHGGPIVFVLWQSSGKNNTFKIPKFQKTLRILRILCKNRHFQSVQHVQWITPLREWTQLNAKTIRELWNYFFSCARFEIPRKNQKIQNISPVFRKFGQNRRQTATYFFRPRLRRGRKNIAIILSPFSHHSSPLRCDDPAQPALKWLESIKFIEIYVQFLCK